MPELDDELDGCELEMTERTSAEEARDLVVPADRDKVLD